MEKAYDALDYYNSLYPKDVLIAKKAESFDKIAKMFYCNNFGSANKSEIELMMFSILMDSIIDNNKNENDVLDYSKSSDYALGKMLGIPQEKVRTLKVKKQARYPVAFRWQESLKSIKHSIVYDEAKDKIIIPLRDPNLYNEIKNFIENNGGYIEIQRGNNCIQIRPQYFFILLYSGMLDDEENEDVKEKEKTRKAFIKWLRENNEKYNIKDIKTDSELSELALTAGDNFMDLAEDFLKSTEEIIKNPLLGVVKGIRRVGKVFNRKK